MAEPLVEFKVDEATTYRFDTVEQAKRWIDEHNDFYNRIRGGDSNDSCTTPIQRAQEAIGNLKDCLMRGIRAIQNNEPSENWFQSFSQQAENIFLNGQAVEFHSRNGIFLQSLLSKSQAMAAGALAALVNQGSISLRSTNADILTGFVCAVIFKTGGPDSINSFSVSLDEATRRHAEHLESMQKQAETQLQEADVTRKTSEQLLADFSSKSTSEFARQSEALDGILRTGETRLQKITHTYEEAMALSAPVAYWRKKRRSHIRWATGWSIIFVAISAVLALLGFLLLPSWLSPDNHGVTTAPAGELGGVPVWRFTFLLLMLLVILWLLRILSRLILSQMHLATDAGHRSVLIQTFLSLLRRNKITDAEREFLFKTIFRPATTGFIKDDAMPASPWSLATSTGK